MVDFAGFLVENELKCTVWSTNLKSATGSNLKSAIFKIRFFERTNSMKKYFEREHEIIMTEDEIRNLFAEFKADGSERSETTFEDFMQDATGRNGSLTAIDDSVKWFKHTSFDGLVRIESDEMQDDFGSDAEQVYCIGATDFGFRFITTDSERIFETDGDCQIIDWDIWE